MRNCLTSCLLLLFASGNLLAQEEFAPAILIQTGDSPLDVPVFRSTATFLGDVDGDGLADLLVGEDHDEGSRLRIYHNQGTKEQPRFEDYDLFRAEGKIAELPLSGEFRPQLVDFNGDGKLDVLTTASGGLVLWYRRISETEFAAAELLKIANGQILSAGRIFGTCHAADWDGDGDTDLILSGRRQENVTETVLVENSGSPQVPSLSVPRPLLVEGQPLQSKQVITYPFVADWNRDGKIDLLLGQSNGTVLLFENRGDNRNPTLSQPRKLVSTPQRAQPDQEKQVIRRGRGGSLCVFDWDNDGKLDILLGDQQSESVQPVLTDEAERLEELRQESTRVLREYRRVRRLSKKLDETQQTQNNFLQQTRQKFAQQLTVLHDEMSQLEAAMQPQWKNHGYVWLLRNVSTPNSN